MTYVAFNIVATHHCGQWQVNRTDVQALFPTYLPLFLPWTAPLLVYLLRIRHIFHVLQP